jgi:hypothetical protein
MILGIFQPCKIGDIIICLPIAKYYADKGFDIIWPINKNLLSHFINNVNYVKFVPYNNYNEFVLKYNCNFILDLCFGIYSTELFHRLYKTQNKYTFDEFKYKIANVPFSEKHKLCINRDKNREEQLFKQVVKKDKYVLRQTKASSQIININIKVADDFQVINIEDKTDCVFDWLGIIEKAQGVFLIESCFTNLIDQLNIKIPKKKCFLKHGYYANKLENRNIHKGMPVLKNDWELV